MRSDCRCGNGLNDRYGGAERWPLAQTIHVLRELRILVSPLEFRKPKVQDAQGASDRDIAQAEGVAVLFTEHDMDVVFGTADRILVLNRGRLIAEGAPADIRANAEVRAIYLGGHT